MLAYTEALPENDEKERFFKKKKKTNISRIEILHICASSL